MFGCRAERSIEGKAMMRILIFVCFLSACTAVFGQTQQQQQAEQERIRRQEQAREAAERLRAQESVRRLRALSEKAYRGPRVSRSAVNDIRDLYREPTGKELKKLRPMDEDLRKYAGFLKNRKTGIIRLEPYSGCGDSTKVISASEDCVEYSMPGNGSDYSFRERNYRIGRLADIRFAEGDFSSPGVLQQAVFVGLGDVPLDKVSPTTPGMAYLNDLKPADNLSTVMTVSETFSRGTEKDGFYYAAAIRGVDDMTYVLRSVAFRGTVVRSIGGVVFNEIDMDDRADITVAFRIVRKHESGGVTILWRELDRKRSPQLIRDDPAPAKTRSPFVAKDFREP
jgi:hypothetical protein